MVRQWKRIFSLSRLIVIDGLRRHALIGLVLLALAGQVGGLLFIDFIPRDIGRVAGDFVFSIIWLTGMIFLFFHAVQVMAWGEDRRVIHTLLAHPISRSEYVLGIFAGLAKLLFLLNLILGGLGWSVLYLIQGSVESYYFPHLSTGYFLLSWSGLFLIELTILSVIILFSGLVRGSFTVLLMTISYYFICNGLPVVREAAAHQQVGIAVSSALQKFLKGLTFVFPDFSRLDYKAFIVAENALPDLGGALTIGFSLSGAYVLLVLGLACVVYKHRDLK